MSGATASQTPAVVTKQAWSTLVSNGLRGPTERYVEPSVWGRLGKRLGPCRGPPGWFRSLPRRLQGVFFPTPVPEKTKLHTFQEQLREFSVWSGLVWPRLVCSFSMLRCRFGSRMPCGSAGRSDNMARFESSLGCPPDQPGPTGGIELSTRPGPSVRALLLQQPRPSGADDGRRTTTRAVFPTSVPEKPKPQTFQERQWEFSVCRMRSAMPAVPSM